MAIQPKPDSSAMSASGRVRVSERTQENKNGRARRDALSEYGCPCTVQGQRARTGDFAVRLDGLAADDLQAASRADRREEVSARGVLKSSKNEWTWAEIKERGRRTSLQKASPVAARTDGKTARRANAAAGRMLMSLVRTSTVSVLLAASLRVRRRGQRRQGEPKPTQNGARGNSAGFSFEQRHSLRPSLRFYRAHSYLFVSPLSPTLPPFRPCPRSVPSRTSDQPTSPRPPPRPPRSSPPHHPRRVRPQSSAGSRPTAKPSPTRPEDSPSSERESRVTGTTTSPRTGRQEEPQTTTASLRQARPALEQRTRRRRRRRARVRAEDPRVSMTREDLCSRRSPRRRLSRRRTSRTRASRRRSTTTRRTVRRLPPSASLPCTLVPGLSEIPFD